MSASPHGRCCRIILAALLLQCNLGAVALSATDDVGFIVLPFPRAENMDVDTFNHEFGPVFLSKPLVVSGSQANFVEQQWTRQTLRDMCGAVPLRVTAGCESTDAACHFVRFVNASLIGVAWAGLQVADLDSLNLTTIADFLDAQESYAPELYLHDAPIRHYCAQAARLFEAPKYFPHDYRLLSHVGGARDTAHHPGIFIGRAGSASPLHTDSAMTRFFMIQLSGRKLWRAFPPSEYGKLYPSDWLVNDVYPHYFHVDAFHPDFNRHPLARGAVVYETVLAPGEVLYVPDAWPHAVINLEDAVSSSLNFVDQFSFDHHWRYRMLKEQDAGAREGLERWRDLLDTPLFPLDHPSRDKGNIPWDDFFPNHDLSTAAVSTALVTYIDSHPDRISSPINRYKQTLLHVAAQFDYVQAAAFLLRRGAEVNKFDDFNRTPMNMAKERNTDLRRRWSLMSELFKIQGGVVTPSPEELAAQQARERARLTAPTPDELEVEAVRQQILAQHAQLLATLVQAKAAQVAEATLNTQPLEHSEL